MNPIKISIVVDPFYQRNEIFNASNATVNRDDCMRPWIELRKDLALNNISLDTVDITSLAEADIVFFINVPNTEDPHLVEAKQNQKKIYCIITELDLIHKANADLEMIKSFDRIFTYQTNLVNNITIFKLNYSFDFVQKAEEFGAKPFKEKKFATIISGNKSLNHANELYSERVNIIRWYEKNHPESFDLYGMGWNMLSINRFTINHDSLGWFKKFAANYYSSYRGKITSKKDTLRSYKFSFCLENAADVPGWITEKLFDCLFNGCVPIYKGAYEISTLVNERCFIDFRKYKDYEELHQYLYTMSEDVYNGYIENIKVFLTEKAADPSYEFGIPYFIETIKQQIKKAI